ncbi:MAG: hypothetical protein HY918_03760 [Candidatus Doudnabacteria bacterium]|nr:hypothetical protein [Candidatus Doudnabacteria bacterium]
MEDVIEAAYEINNVVGAIDSKGQSLKINILQLVKKFGILAGKQYADKETILRFSNDGKSTRIIKVDWIRMSWPEAADAIISNTTYVPEAWVRRTLYLIRYGCYTAYVCPDGETAGLKKHTNEEGGEIVRIPDHLWD